MKKRLLTIVAATLLAPCFALADDAVTPAPAPVIEASKDGFKTLVDNEKTARTDLRTKEASAAAAINADTTLTAEQKAEKLAESRKDYKAQAKAMQQKYVADKKAMRAEIKNDRVEARKADGAKTGGPAHANPGAAPANAGPDKGGSGGQGTSGNTGASRGKR